jgi:hypothetical protein
MVQPADARRGLNRSLDSRLDLDGAPQWRVLHKPQMRPILMVVAHILAHQPFQVPLIQHDDVVQQVASTTPNSTLRDTVLPRAAERSTHRLAAHAFRSRDHVVAKFWVAVE